MPLLRLLLTGVLALTAMGTALLAAIVLMCTALFQAFTGGRARGRANVRPGGAANGRHPPGPDLSGTRGDVIDIEATPVPGKKRGSDEW